ncbi:hypothetical protein [Burkholderia sp. ABCPW 14]|uniref:hypothetical protein n=1 Tax=Burkholderia sp. ABCPW 14 TaxID=1637860 RepID=UPI001E5839BC|nr:hypothetical protein [Burkholderia sp. ABCPW 14]
MNAIVNSRPEYSGASFVNWICIGTAFAVARECKKPRAAGSMCRPEARGLAGEDVVRRTARARLMLRLNSL